MINEKEKKKISWVEEEIWDKAKKEIRNLQDWGELLQELPGLAKILRLAKTLLVTISLLGLTFCAWSGITYIFFNPQHLHFAAILDKNLTLLEYMNYINVPVAVVMVALPIIAYHLFKRRDKQFIELYELKKKNRSNNVETNTASNKESTCLEPQKKNKNHQKLNNTMHINEIDLNEN